MKRVVAVGALLAGLGLGALCVGCDDSATNAHTLFGNTVAEQPGETRSQAVDRMTEQYGPATIVRVYSAGMPEPWPDLNRDLGKVPLVVSFKIDPADVLSGSADADLRAWFEAAPRNRTTYWTYFHEPEDDIEAGVFTAEEYRRAWQHIADIAESVGNPRLKATIVLMCYTVGPLSGRSWQDYVPTSDDLDVLAWDCYNHGADEGTYTDPETLLHRAVEVSDSLGVDWGVAELGSRLAVGDDGSGRAGWLADVGAYAREHDAAFVLYFDVDNGADKNFTLGDPSSISAWRDLVQGTS